MALLGCIIPGCGEARDPNTDELSIGAYSVVREVLARRSACRHSRPSGKSKTGRSVKFEESYNGSGAQARAIASGFDADVAILSHEGDMDVLVEAELVKPAWNAGAAQGHDHPQPGRDRPPAGQPQGDQGLGRPGQAGGRRALPRPQDVGRRALEHQRDLRLGVPRFARRQPGEARPQAVRDLLAKVQANVVNMDPSGRQSMANFAERGTGDAVVTYENELLLHNQGKGKEPIPYVIPPATLLIEGPAAVVEARSNRTAIGQWPRRSWSSCAPSRASRSSPNTASGR